MELYQVVSHQCQLQVYSVNPSHSKTAILFLHGGPGSGAKALIDLPAFQQLSQSFHCIYFDQRGSGNSHYDLSKRISIEDITDDVLKVVKDAKQRFSLEHLFLWGGSFGGLLACLCMQRFIDEFQGIILSSPAITFSREQALAFYNRMKKQYIPRLNTIIENNEIPEVYFQKSDVCEFVLSEHNPSHSLKHIWAMSDWFFQYTFENLFENMNCPLLIMQGQDDPICIFLNIDNEMKDHQRDHIDYHLLNHCGHEVFTDQTQEFVHLIESFIRRVLSC